VILNNLVFSGRTRRLLTHEHVVLMGKRDDLDLLGDSGLDN